MDDEEEMDESELDDGTGREEYEAMLQSQKKRKKSNLTNVSTKDILLLRKLRKESENRIDESLSDGEIRDSPIPNCYKPSNTFFGLKSSTSGVTIRLDKDKDLPNSASSLQKESTGGEEENKVEKSILHKVLSATKVPTVQRSVRLTRNIKEFDSSTEDSEHGRPSCYKDKPPSNNIEPPQDSFFCEVCRLSVREHEAYKHYGSFAHRQHTRNKTRCYLCAKYVDNPKMHLEYNHRKDVFRCLVKDCSQPKFLDLIKILNHI